MPDPILNELETLLTASNIDAIPRAYLAMHFRRLLAEVAMEYDQICTVADVHSLHYQARIQNIRQRFGLDHPNATAEESTLASFFPGAMGGYQPPTWHSDVVKDDDGKPIPTSDPFQGA